MTKVSIEYIAELRSLFRKGPTRPLIVIGVGRSGTTPLRTAIHQHSGVLIASGHCPMIPWFGKAAYQYSAGSSSSYYQRYTALASDELKARLRDICLDCVWNDEELFKVTNTKTSSNASRLDYAGIRRWGTRACPDQQAAAGLSWLFPGTAFVHIVRNGIEVVHSMSKYKAYRHLDFGKRCLLWADRISREHFLSSLAECFPIRFEDMLERPEAVMAALQTFLDLPHEDAPARFLAQNLVHPLSGPTVRANPLSVHRQRQPAFALWSADELNIFRSTCGHAMALLNYPMPF